MPAVYESDGAVVWCLANNNNAVSVPLPATRPIGSVLLFVAWCRLITAAAPAPAGYTLLGTWTSGTAAGGRIWLYAKEVVGGETNPSVTPAGTTGTSGDIWGANIFCYSGVDLSGGIAAILDGTPTVQDASGTTTCTYPALTILLADSMIVRFLARFRDAVDTFTPTATWNEREDAGTTIRLGGQHHWQDKQATASGVQAAVTVAPSNTTAARYLAITAALKAVQPKQTTTAEISLGTISTPETRTAHKIVVRARVASGSGIIRAQLYEGGTARSAVLESSALTGSFVDYALTVADAAAAGITSYADLSIRITGYSAGGAGVFEVSQLYLETPAAPAGPKTLYGATSMAVTFGKAVAGQRKTFGQLVRPFTFASVITGKVTQTHFGSLSLPVAFGAAIDGRRKTLGQLSLPITFSKNIQAQRKTFGQLLSPIIFGASVQGQRKTFGQMTMPIIAAISTDGIRMGLRLYGSLSLPITFGKDVRGQRKAFGQIAMPLTFAKNVIGQRKTFGQITFPIIFTKEAVGRKNVFGALSMQTLFGKETAGRRRTFSQLALPITFSKAVSGQRKTFGQVALSINTTIVISGKVIHNLFGSIAMPLTFGKQVAARRQTFGQITAPYIFGSASQGRRRTFSGIELPINFTTAVKSGPVGVHGALKLELILTMDTKGNIKLFGVILNDALDIYLGNQNVVAAYVGSEQVWP